MDKIEKIRQEVEELYARIDECIDTLIKARVNKDTNGEGKSFFQMEGLMVGTQQFLCWILDTLSEEPDKSMEEAAEKYARLDSDDKCVWKDGGKYKGFIAGAKLQKQQMLKDAVEGEVCGRVYDHINVRFADGVCKYLEPKNISHIPADVSKYNIGDKVRIIIVKAEEE